MRIVDIREKAVPLNSSLRNAVFSFEDMTTSIVAVVTDVIRNGRPIVGYAFNSTGRYAVGAQIRDRMIPRLKRAPETDTTLDPKTFDPDLILKAMMFGEKPGGDMERSVAIGTVENAIWDAVAKIADVPAYKLIADRYNGGRHAEKVFCYVGGGWYAPGKGIPELLEEMRGHLGRGYTLLKMKVGGAPIEEDVRRLEAVINLVGDPSRVAVDANCGIGPDRRPAYAKALAPFGLRWFEEVAHPVDYQGNADFIAAYGGAVATGENLFSVEDFRNLARHGGMRPGKDVIMIDIPQSYGIGTAAKVLGTLGEFGWTAASVLPHGGNQMSFNHAAGLGLGMCEAYPDAFGVFSGYADDARVEDGWIKSGDFAGMGFERQNALYALMKTLVE